MPREMARQSVRQEAAGNHRNTLEVEVRQTDQTVRVTLSGILDRQGVGKLISRVTPALRRRGDKIILDGSRLTHLDYRATGQLVAWNRRLRLFGHQLMLLQWSPYLKAILLMEDWNGELAGRPSAALDQDLVTRRPTEAMP